MVKRAELEPDPQARRRQLRSTLPHRVADHELIRPVGAGSYGEVWIAKNSVTSGLRAIKIVWRDFFENAKPYEREFEAIKRFEPLSRTHPGFVDVLQVGRLENGFYYVMELADDIHGAEPIETEHYRPATLAARRRKDGSVEEAIQIGIALSKSLAALHDAGLIHRDVKPGNIIFVKGEAKLADIGLVALVSEANSIVGTNGFIAPEGPTTIKSDIFGLGKLLYEVATGLDRLDFPALPETASENQTLLLEMNQVILKACDPDPRKRHATARHLLEELEALEQGRSIRRVRQLERTLRWTRASALSIILLSIAVFSLIYASQVRRGAAELVLQRRISSSIAQGMEKIKIGDYLAALNYFEEGSSWDKDNRREHELRVESTKLIAPKLIADWKSDSDVACFAERSSLLVTKHKDTIRVIDILTKEVAHEFSGPVSTLSIDPDGRQLAIGHGNEIRFISLSDSVTRNEVFLDSVRHVSIADAERYAVTTKNGDVFWSESGKANFLVTTNAYKAVLSPSARLLVLLRPDGVIQIYNTERREMLPFFAKHKSLPYNALFIRKESALITCSYDRSAICWDIGTATAIGLPLEHDGGVLYIGESPDQTVLATASLDRTVKLWQAASFLPVRVNHTLYHESPVSWVKFCSGNSLLTHTESGSTALWSIAPPTNICREVPFEVGPPDRKIAQGAGFYVRGLGRVVSGDIDGIKVSIEMDYPVESVAINPKKTVIAIGTADGSRIAHSALLFDIRGKRIGDKMRHRDGITYVGFSNSGERLVTCSEDFTARVWDSNGMAVTSPLEHRGQVRWAAFNRSDKWIATVGHDEKVRLWNVETGMAITPPLDVNNVPEYVAFRTDEELLVSNTLRNYICSLRMKSGFSSR